MVQNFRRIEEIELAKGNVARPPSAATAGEACRPFWRVTPALLRNQIVAERRTRAGAPAPHLVPFGRNADSRQ